MIVVQTPLRVSFLGGGTDFEGFYKEYGGIVLSTAIDKSVFVIVKKRFDSKIYLNYSRKEIVDNVCDIEHDLIRCAMLLTGVDDGVEITVLADIPSSGSGLGSSSSITVALLHALYTYRNVLVDAERLAREACYVEIEMLGKPIGKQDQYIAAYGGTCIIEFNGDGIKIDKMDLSDAVMRCYNENLLMFYTGIGRIADVILEDQNNKIMENVSILCQMRDLVYSGKKSFISGDISHFGYLLDKNWKLKKGLASKISDSELDSMYKSGIDVGATGGKVLGAGGGGFMLFCCPEDIRENLRAKLSNLVELPFNINSNGSRIIFNK